MTSIVHSFHAMTCSDSRNASRGSIVLGAVLGALAAWLVGRYIGQVDMAAPGMPASDVGQFIAVGVSTAIAGLIAWGLLVFLERHTANPWRTWSIIAAIVLVVSMLGPLGAETALGKTQLSVVHAIVAAILYRGFRLTVDRDTGR